MARDDKFEEDFGGEIDFDFEAFDSSGGKPAKGLVKGAKSVSKGIVSGMLKEVIKFASDTVPGGASLLAEANDIRNGVKGQLGQLKEDTREARADAKRLGRATLPSIKKFMPAKMYQRLSNLTADTSAYSSFNQRESDEAELQSNLNETLGMQGSLVSEAVAARVETRQIATSQIKVLTSIQKNAILHTQFRESTQRAYMRKNLELQYRHLAVMTEMRDLTKSQITLSQEAFNRIIFNTALPDAIKFSLEQNLKNQLKNTLIKKSVSGMKNLALNATSNVINNPEMLASLGFVGSAADMMEMSNEMGMTFNPYQYIGKQIGGRIAKKATRYIPKKYLEKAGKISRTSSDILQSFQGGGVGAQEWLRRRSGKGWKGALGRAVAGSLSGTPDVTFKNAGLDDPEGVGHITNRFTSTVTDIIPSYLSEIEKHLHSLVTGERKENKVFDIVGGKLSTASAARAAMDEHVFSGKKDGARAIGTAVGATMTAAGKKSKLLAGKGVEDLVRKVITNAAAHNIPIHSFVFEQVLAISRDDQLSDPTLIKLSAGIQDKVKALKVMHSIITDKDGKERMEVTRAINAGVYEAMFNPQDEKKLAHLAGGQYRELYRNARTSEGTFKKGYYGEVLNGNTNLEYIRSYAQGSAMVDPNNPLNSAHLGSEYKKAKQLSRSLKKEINDNSTEVPGLRTLYANLYRGDSTIRARLADSDLSPKSKQQLNGRLSRIEALSKGIDFTDKNVSYERVSGLIEATKNLELQRAMTVEKLERGTQEKMLTVQSQSNQYLAEIREYTKHQVLDNPSIFLALKKMDTAIKRVPYTMGDAALRFSGSAIKTTAKLPFDILRARALRGAPDSVLAELDDRNEGADIERGYSKLDPKGENEIHVRYYAKTQHLLQKIAKSTAITAGAVRGTVSVPGSDTGAFGSLITRNGSWQQRRAKEALGGKTSLERKLATNALRSPPWMSAITTGIKVLVGAILFSKMMPFMPSVASAAGSLLKKGWDLLPSGSSVGKVLAKVILPNNNKVDNTSNSEVRHLNKSVKFKTEDERKEYTKLLNNGKIQAAHEYAMSKNAVSTSMLGELKTKKRKASLMKQFNFTDKEKKQIEAAASTGNMEYLNSVADVMVKQKRIKAGRSLMPQNRRSGDLYSFVSKSSRAAMIRKRIHMLLDVRFNYKDGTSSKLSSTDIETYARMVEENSDKAAHFLYDLLNDKDATNVPLASSGFAGLFTGASKYKQNIEKYGVAPYQKTHINRLMGENRIIEMEWYLEDILYATHKNMGVEQQKAGFHMGVSGQAQRTAALIMTNIGLRNADKIKAGATWLAPKIKKAWGGIKKLQRAANIARLRKQGTLLWKVTHPFRATVNAAGSALSKAGKAIKSGTFWKALGTKANGWWTTAKTGAVNFAKNTAGPAIAKAFSVVSSSIIGKLPAAWQGPCNRTIATMIRFITSNSTMVSKLLRFMGSIAFALVLLIVGIIVGAFQSEEKSKQFISELTEDQSSFKKSFKDLDLSDLGNFLSLVLRVIDPYEVGKLLGTVMRLFGDMLKALRNGHKAQKKTEEFQKQCIEKLRKKMMEQGKIKEFDSIKDIDAMFEFAIATAQENSTMGKIKTAASEAAIKTYIASEDVVKKVVADYETSSHYIDKKVTAGKKTVVEAYEKTSERVTKETLAGYEKAADYTGKKIDQAKNAMKPSAAAVSAAAKEQALATRRPKTATEIASDKEQKAMLEKELQAQNKERAAYMAYLENNSEQMKSIAAHIGMSSAASISAASNMAETVRSSAPKSSPQSVINRSQQ